MGRLSIALVRVALLLGASTSATLAVATENGMRVIPLSTVVTTSPQARMRYFENVFPKSAAGNAAIGEDYYRRLNTDIAGASNVFLVDAMNERGAISASIRVFFAAQSADIAAPLNLPDPIRGSHWLVAYLGIGPSRPTRWVIEEALVEAGKIRLTYRKADATIVTGDIRSYYFWVPLGKLPPDVYSLELYDAGLKAATLSRRVEVEQEKHR